MSRIYQLYALELRINELTNSFLLFVNFALTSSIIKLNIPSLNFCESVCSKQQSYTQLSALLANYTTRSMTLHEVFIEAT